MLAVLPLIIMAATGGPSHDALGHAHAVPVLSGAPAPSLLTAPTRRVRAMDQHAERLLAEGMRRSRTFASLMAAIQKTDVIVYVESTRHLPPRVGGRLLLQAVTERERYLRVQVLATLQQNGAIEIVAHELRHVLEVAAEPSVVDDAGLVALYRRIGYPSLGERGYDTNAARLTGHVVRRELGG